MTPLRVGPAKGRDAVWHIARNGALRGEWFASRRWTATPWPHPERIPCCVSPASNQPTRIDLPLWISRSSTERYFNQLNPDSELVFDVDIPLGRLLDHGSLLDELAYDSTDWGYSIYEHELCCDPLNPFARPESLRKSWKIWVPVCEANELPGQNCASEAELMDLGEVQIVVEVGFKEL